MPLETRQKRLWRREWTKKGNGTASISGHRSRMMECRPPAWIKPARLWMDPNRDFSCSSECCFAPTSHLLGDRISNTGCWSLTVEEKKRMNLLCNPFILYTFTKKKKEFSKRSMRILRPIKNQSNFLAPFFILIRFFFTTRSNINDRYLHRILLFVETNSNV